MTKIVNKDSFIIKTEKDIPYLDETIEYLDNKEKNLLNFFELNNLKEKKEIIIWTDLDEYKKHIEKYCEYKDYMCGDTFDGNINMLSIEECHKTKEHHNMKVEEFKANIVHEFVHVCQQEKEEIPINEKSWFWESLATNLGNPEVNSVCKFSITRDELEDFIQLKNNYKIAFTIGKYMLENYSHEEIINYVKYPEILLQDTDTILSNAIEYSKTISKEK